MHSGSGYSASTYSASTLYFPDIFDQEEQRARKHIETYDKNSEVSLDDYDIYKIIDESHCNPEQLKDLGKAGEELPWLDEINNETWTEDVKRKAKIIKETMDDYDS